MKLKESSTFTAVVKFIELVLRLHGTYLVREHQEAVNTGLTAFLYFIFLNYKYIKGSPSAKYNHTCCTSLSLSQKLISYLLPLPKQGHSEIYDCILASWKETFYSPSALYQQPGIWQYQWLFCFLR